MAKGEACQAPLCKICETRHQGPRCPKFYGDSRVRVMSAEESRAAQADKSKLLALPPPKPAAPKKKAKKKA